MKRLKKFFDNLSPEDELFLISVGLLALSVLIMFFGKIFVRYMGGITP